MGLRPTQRSRRDGSGMRKPRQLGRGGPNPNTFQAPTNSRPCAPPAHRLETYQAMVNLDFVPLSNISHLAVNPLFAITYSEFAAVFHIPGGPSPTLPNPAGKSALLSISEVANHPLLKGPPSVSRRYVQDTHDSWGVKCKSWTGFDFPPVRRCTLLLSDPKPPLTPSPVATSAPPTPPARSRTDPGFILLSAHLHSHSSRTAGSKDTPISGPSGLCGPVLLIAVRRRRDGVVHVHQRLSFEQPADRRGQ